MIFSFGGKGLKKNKSKEELAIKGDKNAFVELIQESKLSLYRVSMGILNNEDKADEAIQSTIVKAYEKIETLKNPEYFKTWIIRILINECNGVFRKEKKVLYLEDRYSSEKYEDVYEDVDLITAINKLDADLKEVVILYYFEDIPQKEIGKILNINENTIRTRLLRARKKLYSLLTENEGDKYGY